MKLIVQIPCWNEEALLPRTLADIPRRVAGVDEVEILIIDDGSTDRTLQVARAAGADHFVRLRCHQGLARAFAVGLDASLELGADIIVNTDADNQYRGSDIEALVRPIVSGEASMVVGDRRTDTIAHFSPTKRLLQRVGSWVVRQASDTHIPDATSGFRAYSREAALCLNVVSEYTYTLETIIQAGKRGLALVHVPITVNEQTRESRLIRSVPDYLRRSAGTILRIYAMYEPLRVFSIISATMLALGLALAARYLYFVFVGEGKGHVQSVMLSGVLLAMAVQMFLIGLVADLVATNRRLSEEVLLRVKKLELKETRDVKETEETPSEPVDRGPSA